MAYRAKLMHTEGHKIIFTFIRSFYIGVKFLWAAAVNASQLIFVLQFWTELTTFYRLRSVQTRYGALVSLILNQ